MKSKFVDLRFTDTKGKEQHVTIPAHQVNAEFFEEGKCLTAPPLAAERH
ncbi:glutamine synthetase beta-grasp domain-containing protein [Shigella flexneri]